MSGARAHCRGALLLCASLSLASCTTSGFRTPVETVEAKPLVMPSGVSIQDLVVGTGPPAIDGAMVSTHYVGTLDDEHVFDSSRDSGPLSFTLGKGEVIRGWEEGMLGMRQGGKRRITIPPDSAYGAKGRPGLIPPNATIVIEVELLQVFAP